MQDTQVTQHTSRETIFSLQQEKEHLAANCQWAQAGDVGLTFWPVCFGASQQVSLSLGQRWPRNAPDPRPPSLSHVPFAARCRGC